MPVKLTKMTVTQYLLPPDGLQAKRDFISMLSLPGELYIGAYAFTDREVINLIRQQDEAGVVQHLLLDASQFVGAYESQVMKDFRLTNGDCTVSTAGPTSSKTHVIQHQKIAIKLDAKGGEAYIWCGSVNFSEMGWYQANTVTTFRSTKWATEVYIPWFLTTKEWALKNVPQQAEKVLSLVPEWQEEEDTIPDWLKEVTDESYT